MPKLVPRSRRKNCAKSLVDPEAFRSKMPKPKQSATNCDRSERGTVPVKTAQISKMRYSSLCSQKWKLGPQFQAFGHCRGSSLRLTLNGNSCFLSTWSCWSFLPGQECALHIPQF